MKLIGITYDRRDGEWCITTLGNLGFSYTYCKDLEAVFDALRTLNPDCTDHNSSVLTYTAKDIISAGKNFSQSRYFTDQIIFRREIKL